MIPGERPPLAVRTTHGRDTRARARSPVDLQGFPDSPHRTGRPRCFPAVLSAVSRDSCREQWRAGGTDEPPPVVVFGVAAMAIAHLGTSRALPDEAAFDGAEVTSALDVLPDPQHYRAPEAIDVMLNSPARIAADRRRRTDPTARGGDRQRRVRRPRPRRTGRRTE